MKMNVIKARYAADGQDVRYRKKCMKVVHTQWCVKEDEPLLPHVPRRIRTETLPARKNQGIRCDVYCLKSWRKKEKQQRKRVVVLPIQFKKH